VAGDLFELAYGAGFERRYVSPSTPPSSDIFRSLIANNIVPEFQTPPPSGWSLPTISLPRYTLKKCSPEPAPNPFTLPELPEDFEPLSRTEDEKRLSDIQKARNAARAARLRGENALNPDILENWYCQAEIAGIRADKEYNERMDNLERVREAVEK
jgi:hypothetical protein